MQNLTNRRLLKLVRGLSPLLRLGGTAQDLVLYNIGSINRPCLPFKCDPSQFRGSSGGCLNMTRWDALNEFFNHTRASVAFGLNALYGREKNMSIGQWDPSNAEAFINYTASKGYEIFALELGNELNRIISAPTYAIDAKKLRDVVDNIYGDSPTKPLVVAPDSDFIENWYKEFLQSLEPGVIDIITYHIYPLGLPTNISYLEKEIFNATFLDQIKTTFSQLSNLLKEYGSSIQPWIGEDGGVINGGSPNISGTFVDSFWYLDHLGSAAAFGTHGFCRQTLVGNSYGLLNKTNYEPNPDFYGALIWKKLMGEKVLHANVTKSEDLRVYAHCSKNDKKSATLLLINLSNTTDYNVSLLLDGSTGQQEQRLEYHLTAPNKDLLTRIISLNGKELLLSPDDQLPDLNPLIVNNSTPIVVVRSSIVFVKLLRVSLLGCTLV
ncbi:hypothetical protein O6H91_14G049200 [Diphasiastrum complanatum]|uniref:Uncharacterized protein n=1 Tax=Diphasiastrum complanatum TaxID=34168 RepID=A0ACC2BP57_DIPCM|nr:hypothetical protein O6H91_14G049200 [Diphasiastrum complanatum]